MEKFTLLLVEDDKVQREALAENLIEEDYNVLVAESAEKALSIADSKTVDLVITDLNLPGDDGHFLLKKIKSKNPTIPVFIITAYASVGSAELQ